jgi:hypothetical protein
VTNERKRLEAAAIEVALVTGENPTSLLNGYLGYVKNVTSSTASFRQIAIMRSIAKAQGIKSTESMRLLMHKMAKKYDP